jgi:hypothetical protein
MKAIFVFPALPAFIYFYVVGLDQHLTRAHARSAIVWAHSVMLALWLWEGLHLFGQLAFSNSSRAI